MSEPDLRHLTPVANKRAGREHAADFARSWAVGIDDYRNGILMICMVCVDCFAKMW